MPAGLVTSLCFCSFATVPLLLHLHRPERAFNVMNHSQRTSAMAGFGFIYSLYMLVLIVEVWLVFRPEIALRGQTTGGLLGLVYRTLALGVKEVRPESKRLDDKVIHFLALAGIPIACVLHGYVGFCSEPSKPIPVFDRPDARDLLISAIVSGIAD